MYRTSYKKYTREADRQADRQTDRQTESERQKARIHRCRMIWLTSSHDTSLFLLWPTELLNVRDVGLKNDLNSNLIPILLFLSNRDSAHFVYKKIQALLQVQMDVRDTDEWWTSNLYQSVFGSLSYTFVAVLSYLDEGAVRRGRIPHLKATTTVHLTSRGAGN